MKKKIVWLILSCLMALSLVVTSCGPAVTEEEEEEVITEEEEEEVVTEEEVVAEGMVVNTAGKLVERPRYGGIYHFSIGGDVRGFDDQRSASPHYAVAHLNLIYDKLFTGDWTKGSQGTGEFTGSIYANFFPHLEIPNLATGYEIPDDETLIYHIRRGVYFQNKPPVNGREMNAHDVAFNLHRAFYNPGAFLSLLYPPDKGKGPTSITAIDDWTVEIKCPPVWLQPIHVAVADWVFIFPPELVEEYGDMNDWQNACGTGAFLLTDYVPVSSLTLERNPNYWLHNPLHPEDQLPYIDGVEIVVIPDPSTSQAAFRTGKIETRYGQNKDDWEALMRTAPELLWDKLAPGSNSAIYMRTDKPELPYNDVRVRRALMMGINHPAILEDYYGGEGEVLNVPVASLPEFADMYTPLEELPEEDQKLYGYYPEEARQLLAEAGYPDGFECTVLASGEGLLPIIMSDWEKISVEMTIDIKTSAVVSAMSLGGRHEDMLYSVAIGTNPLILAYWDPTSNQNFSRVDDEYFNEKYEIIAANQLNWDKASEVVKELNLYLISQAYFINMPNDYSYFLWWPWLKGWRGETSIGYWSVYRQLNYLWLDTDLRKEMTGREN